MSAIVTHKRKQSAAQHLGLAPLKSVSLCDQAYAKLKDAIAQTDIYNQRQPLRLQRQINSGHVATQHQEQGLKHQRLRWSGHTHFVHP